MKTFYVYKHDCYWISHLNTQKGFYASEDKESFRDLTPESIEWSLVVDAANERAAITKALSYKNFKRA